ncbi:MAG: dihydrolipoyl dehydrogenase [Acidobacteria bacterium]|nr:dihydrolipoyl dehydrogenase [Acidobacteriota bacterium]
MPTEKCDVAVIGSGPGGYVAAIRAGQLGLKTILIERDPLLGGTCLHRGCIPTKALLHSASILDTVRDAGSFGVKAGDPTVDFEGVHRHKNKVVRSNAKGIEFLMKKNGVTVLTGTGKLAGKGRITVAGGAMTSDIEAASIIVATGSAPRAIPAVKIDGKRVLTSDELLELKQIPKSLIVLGAGAVGVEFATVFNRFGSRVTLVEMLPRILPIEDEECSAELEKALRKRKITILTGVTAEGFEVSASSVKMRATAPDGTSTPLEAEILLVAVGRRPVTDGLNLEATKAVVEKGFIKVDPFMRSAEPGLYAIGDVVAMEGGPHPQLAHVASAEGVLAAEHIAGREAHPLNYGQIPSCTYCEPEVASVGISERKARERGFDVKVGKFPWTALGKAKILGASEGFVKIVSEAKYGEILGVHIVGPHATDLIAEAVVAMKAEATVDELVHTVHAHPTLAEGIHEAAEGVLGSYIHI